MRTSLWAGAALLLLQLCNADAAEPAQKTKQSKEPNPRAKCLASCTGQAAAMYRDCRKDITHNDMYCREIQKGWHAMCVDEQCLPN